MCACIKILFLTTRTSQMALVTTCLEILPSNDDVVLLKLLLPTTMFLNFSCSAIVTKALNGRVH